MALIGEIRKKSWLLILAIGLGLASFIMMDMFSGDKSVFGSGQTTVGSIAGEEVDWQEFNRVEQALYGNSGGDVFSRRNSLWNYFVEEKVIQKEAEQFGLGVSRDELLELEFSTDNRRISPVIFQRFSDPNTRQIDRARLSSFQQAINEGNLTPEYQIFWKHQEGEIIKDRLQSKLSNLINKAVYTPTWMAEMTHENNAQQVNFDYVKIPFDEIADSEINLTDADYNSFLQKNKSKYTETEEARKIDYVSFQVIPTKEDSLKVYNDLNGLLPDFRTTDNDSSYVERFYGAITGNYLKRAKLSPVYGDSLFNVANGSVVGPFQDGKSYVAIKVLDKKVIPDSVESRHILINAKTQPEYLAAQKTIDSLKVLVESGAHSFSDLAVSFSQGPSGPQGGDLGFSGPGRMVQPFNDLIFHNAEKGKVYSVVTQFGVHLVEVTDQKFINNESGVKIAVLTQNIVPSEDTQKNMYDKVLEFIGNNRTLSALTKSVAEDPSITLETSPPIKTNDHFVGSLGGNQTSRDIVKWAYEQASIGDVSPEIYVYNDEVDFYDAKYVIAGLNSVQGKGLSSLAFVKNEIEPLVRNEKKGEMLKGKISAQNLASVVSAFSGTSIETLTDVNFNSRSVSGLGNEPKVIARAFDLELNQVSDPIVGNNGVYVVQLKNKPALSAATNIPQLRQTASTQARTQMSGQLPQALRKNAQIEDNRSRFY